MNKYKIQVINSCQEFLNDLKEYNISIHNQLCDAIREVMSDPFKSKFKRLENSEDCSYKHSIYIFNYHPIVFGFWSV